MAHPRVEQLRFARAEFVRGLEGIREDVARRELGQMNSITWMIGHMAWHEQLSWLTRAQGITPVPVLLELAANRGPKSNPGLDDMWAAWEEVTAAADAWLDALTHHRLAEPMGRSRITQSIGTALLRMTYHYFVHTGEASAVRQVVEGGSLPEFIGEIQDLAPWRPEPCGEDEPAEGAPA